LHAGCARLVRRRRARGVSPQAPSPRSAGGLHVTIAIYPGTFDPITTGHVSVVREAVRLFAHVRVLIARHPTKEPLFTLEERVELARAVLGALPTVSVASTPGLVVEYARSI